jgi:hypothetical protein
MRLNQFFKPASKSLYFGLGIVATLFILFLFLSFFFTDGNVVKNIEEFPQKYRIVSPEVPANLDFAGEKIPLDNFEVKERIERELIVNTYLHSATIMSIKRAGRWFPVIEPILKRNGIPDDFKYLCVAESNLDNAVSPAGAKGFWQFINETGKKYGLEINDAIDERYNIEKSTEAACAYLKDAYIQFGSWTMAAASYNMGMNGVEKQRGRQKTNNFFNLVLGEETSRYIARIVAIKEILKSPTDYGYDLKGSEIYQPLKFKTITVDTSISDLADFAFTQNINYKTLKYYNPWLRDISLSNKIGKTYYIKLPEAGSINLIRE